MTLPLRSLRLIQIFCLCLLGVAAYFFMNVSSETSPESPLLPIETNVSAPVRIRIPVLGTDAPIKPVGEDREGNMEVPASPSDVGWFAPGIIPGSPMGSAVLAGHVDTTFGDRGVFWNLSELLPGDDVYLETGSGKTLHFRVLGSDIYPYDQAPLQEIFKGAGEPLLNLITCRGTWVGRTYDERLVVSARLIGVLPQ